MCARNRNARLLYSTSTAHVKYSILDKFVDAIDEMYVHLCGLV